MCHTESMDREVKAKIAHEKNASTRKKKAQKTVILMRGRRWLQRMTQSQKRGIKRVWQRRNINITKAKIPVAEKNTRKRRLMYDTLLTIVMQCRLCGHFHNNKRGGAILFITPWWLALAKCCRKTVSSWVMNILYLFDSNFYNMITLKNYNATLKLYIAVVDNKLCFLLFIWLVRTNL